MSKFLSKYMIQYGDYRVDGETIMFPVQNIVDDETNILIVNEEGSRLDQELEKGSFTIVGENLDDTIYFTKTIDEALVINRSTGNSAVVYYEAWNCKAVMSEFYNSGCATKSIAIVDGTSSYDEIDEIEHSKQASSLISIHKHSEFNNFAEMMLKRGYPFVTKEIQAIESVKDRKKGFTFTRVTDLGELKATQWAIENLLEEEGFSVVYGPSGHCKSFAVLDMCCAIASGRDYNGLKTRKGVVLYICGEGQNGINGRIKGWQKANNHEGELDLFMVPETFTPADDESLEQFMSDVKSFCEESGLDVTDIFIDTLNRSFGGGDENSTQDMTKFSNACIELRKEVGCGITVVHHTSDSNPRKSKGNNALKGSLESEINILKPCNKEGEQYGYVELKVTKQKNGKEIAPIFFMPDEIEVGEDNEGNLVTSINLRSGPEVDRFVKECAEAESEGKDKPKASKREVKKNASIKLKQKLNVEPSLPNDFDGIPEYAQMIKYHIEKTRGRFSTKSELMEIIKSKGIKNGSDVIKYMAKNKIAKYENEVLTLL